MRMHGLACVDFSIWHSQLSPADTRKKRLFVTVSGYEERASYFSRKVLGVIGPSETTKWLTLGFTDHKDDPGRLENDAFFSSHGLLVREFPSHDQRGALAFVRETATRLMEQFPRSELEIHVDYSSMPRVWYCFLFDGLEAMLGPNASLYFWYSAGIYDGTEYPTAGVSDVEVFSGKPTLNAGDRTHIFGLGFDRIRSSAIFRVLDPQRLVCFYADPGIRTDYVQRVIEDNRDIIAAATLVFTVPISDFGLAFGRIASMARQFVKDGDVILVPDGPKPLVLASSLVPGFLDRDGIVSLHVKRRKIGETGKVNVRPAGEIYGFQVGGGVRA
jgi:hypothetical protein